jgi:fatty-acid desaturase
MPTEQQSENKMTAKIKIGMTLATIVLIILLFTVSLWRSNMAATSTVSKVVGFILFAVAFGSIAIEKKIRNALPEAAFYIVWFVSLILALLLCMGGGL